MATDRDQWADNLSGDSGGWLTGFLAEEDEFDRRSLWRLGSWGVGSVAAVIVDYHMPEMNGHEVATEIKRLRPQIPIVMVSSDEEIPEHVFRVVDAFVSKDQASSRLLPVITQICGGNASGIQEGGIGA